MCIQNQIKFQIRLKRPMTKLTDNILPVALRPSWNFLTYFISHKFKWKYSIYFLILDPNPHTFFDF